MDPTLQMTAEQPQGQELALAWEVSDLLLYWVLGAHMPTKLGLFPVADAEQGYQALSS